MAKRKFVSRAVLAQYAAVLGRDSLAACALRYYDSLEKAKIEMYLTGFAIHTKDGIAQYG